MGFLRKLPLFPRAFACFGLMILSACSNPLSSGKTTALQSFHTQDISCDQLNFSDPNVTAPQLRAIIRCINSNHEIEAFQTLFDQINDDELAPITSVLNDIFQNQPKFLFEVREVYNHAKEEGDFAKIEDLLAKLFADPKLNVAVTSILNKNAGAFSALFSDKNLNLHTAGILSITNSSAYQRTGKEYLSPDNLVQLGDAISRYLKTSDAKNISDLYQMLATHNVDQIFNGIVANNSKVRIQNLAHFFEWIFNGPRYAQISSVARSMLNGQVTCFNGGKTIENPIAKGLKRISGQNSAAAAKYFAHDLKNMILASQGYCKFPTDLTVGANYLEQATQVRGFDEAYTLLQPLLTDDTFLHLVGSTASTNFVQDVTWLADQHFFEDLFTVVMIDLNSPISDNAASLANLLNQVLPTLTHDDYTNFIHFLQPILSQDQKYGLVQTQLLYKLLNSAPDTVFDLNDHLRKNLQTFTNTLFQKTAIADVMTLTVNLVQTKRADMLLDQSLNYFSSLFEKGRFNLIFQDAIHPQIMAQSVSGWLIDKLSPEMLVASPCGNINLSWNFDDFLSQNKTTYLSQIDSIKNCIDNNPVMTAASDLAGYATSKAELATLLNVQGAVINEAFNLNLNLMFSTVNDFLTVSQSDSNTIRSFLDYGSNALSEVAGSIKDKTNLKAFLSRLLNGKTLYAAAEEWLSPTPARTRSSAPTLDLNQMTTINVAITREKIMKNVSTTDAMKAIFATYCPSISSFDRTCLIEQDQIDLYQKSPQKLYEQIVSELLNSSQSWAHPLLFKGWDHNVNPTEVSDFEFHLNPLLHSIRGSPQAPQSILNAVKRIQHDKIDLGTVLKDRALRLTLIPYYYQNPGYPGKTQRQYSNRVRLRLVTDLDRLELIATNADFKAFGFVQNIGMGFIRDIGLAWGDVAENDRPSTLSQFVKTDQIKTLKEVKESVQSQVDQLDYRFLQKWGQCRVPSKGLAGDIVPLFCSNEISDLSARLFNFRSLISLLDDELPAKDGGFGGLEFLRDLFYSLYEADSSDQRNVFTNGVILDKECLQDPMSFPTPVSKCKNDLLTLIPRITRLGVLHAAAIAVLKHQDHPIDAIASLINRVSANSAINALFVKALSSDNGIVLAQDAVAFGFQAPDNSATGLNLAIQTIASTTNTNWINAVLEAPAKYPHVLADHRVLLNAVLSTDVTNLAPWVDRWVNTPSAPTVSLLNDVSINLDPGVRSDLIQFLKDLTPTSNALASVLQSVKKLPDLQNTTIRKDLSLWTKQLQADSSESTRKQLSQWVTSPGFDQFCSVFSDSVFLDKTYNFLEAINQNPDSKAFFQYCQDFF